MAINREKALSCLAKYESVKERLSTAELDPKLLEQVVIAQLTSELGVTPDSIRRYVRMGRQLKNKPVKTAQIDKPKRKPTYQVEGNDGLKVLYIPDTQIKVGADTEHIRASARYAVSKKPDVIVIAGDWHDMPSLSVFNSRMENEGLRVKDDIQAGNDALDEFMQILIDNDCRPEIHITLGNHSAKVRIDRFLKENPHMIGLIEDTATAHFKKYGIIVHDFLDILNINDIRFSHYIANPHSLKGSPLGGACDTMLKNAGFSFVMGHQQGLKMAKHYLSDGTRRIGIVAGSFYPHDEDYMSIQANKHWRGIIMLNEVKDGGADICEVSLNYLMKNYGD